MRGGIGIGVPWLGRATAAADLRTQVINALFGGGAQGVFYDPSDLSTLWQDAAGTTPVTADGDPVGRVDDLSGNDNPLIQTTATSRPRYKTDGTLHWIEGDGVDDWLETEAAFSPALSQPGFSNIALQTSTTATAVLQTGLGSKLVSGSSWELFLLNSGTDLHFFAGIEQTAFAEDSNPFITRVNWNQAFSTVHKNGVLSATADAGTNPLAHLSLLGRYNGLYTPMKLYGFVLTEGTPSGQDLSDQWLAEKSGVTLP